MEVLADKQCQECSVVQVVGLKGRQILDQSWADQLSTEHFPLEISTFYQIADGLR